MKKIIAILFTAAVFAACSNRETTSEPVVSDSSKVDSIVVVSDSVAKTADCGDDSIIVKDNVK